MQISKNKVLFLTFWINKLEQLAQFMYFLFGLVRYMEVSTWTGFLACGLTCCWDSTRCWDSLVGDFSRLSCLWHCSTGVCSVLSVLCILSMSGSSVQVVFNSSVSGVSCGGCGSITGRMWCWLRLYSFPSESTTYERGSSHFHFTIPTLSCPLCVWSLTTWFGSRGRSGLLVLS